MTVSHEGRVEKHVPFFRMGKLRERLTWPCRTIPRSSGSRFKAYSPTWSA